MSAINAFNLLYCNFLYWKKKTNKRTRLYLKPSSQIRLTSLWVSTLIVSGEKNLLLRFCLQHVTGETPGAPLPAIPPKPAWDLVHSVCRTHTGNALCSFHTRINFSSLTQTLQLFFSCPSLQIPFSLVSAGVLLIWCFLGTSSWVDTVLWMILEFLLESHFIFSWSIPHVLLYFTLLTKFPDFQAEGVISRDVK